MAYGLTINNSGGELVVDSDSRGLHYIGQATYSTDVTQSPNTSFVHERVLRRYTITLANSSAVPLAAFKPTTDRWMSMQYVRRSAAGSATWYIDLYSADSSSTGFSITDMTTTASAEVHVWSTQVPSGAAYGLRLFDSSGNLTWDFGAKPLFVRQVMNFPTQTDRTTYVNGDSQPFASGISVPLILPGRAHGKDNVRIGSTGSHNDSQYVYQLDGAGNLKRVKLNTYWESGETGGSPYTPQPDWALPAQMLFVMDANDYA